MQSVLGSAQSLTDGFLNLQLLQQVCTYYWLAAVEFKREVV